MIQKIQVKWLVAILVLAVSATGAQAVTITHGIESITMDFVSVGHTDNLADDTTYGAVDYPYRISKHEVTSDQWFVVLLDSNAFSTVGDWSGDQPVAGISWHEAAMFCNWLTSGDVTDGAYTIDGNDVVTAIDRAGAVSTHGTVYVIPTENEWYKAAYYNGGASVYYDFPTASDTVPDGIDSNGDTEFDAVFWDGYDQGQPNDVNNAGVLSPYGTMGQGGNVDEWTEMVIGSNPIVRGGSWASGWNGGLDAATGHVSEEPGAEDDNRGFRVASIPEPGSITLLVCGLVSLICLRRRK